jgi:hypothetical protein
VSPTASEPESESEPDAELNPEPDREPNAEPDPEPNPEPDPEPNHEPGYESDAGADRIPKQVLVFALSLCCNLGLKWHLQLQHVCYAHFKSYMCIDQSRDLTLILSLIYLWDSALVVIQSAFMHSLYIGFAT